MPERLRGVPVASVSEVNAYMKLLTDNDPALSSLWVRGEISNFTHQQKTGHMFFTLKDAGGMLKAVMFRSDAEQIRFRPENGMQVLARGRISVFPRDGVYQLYVNEMEPDGVGALYLAFEQTKRQLEAEGIFDPERKRAIPRYPQRIALITSPDGAALRDMVRILGRRYPLAEVLICGALVQGAAAPASLRSALAICNRVPDLDLIILGRGGGSIEDLWAFNDADLARDVARSNVPVISAVGHETDFTICDFAADLRAATPSAAAELSVPDRTELSVRVRALGARLAGLMQSKYDLLSARLEQLGASRVLQSPLRSLDDRQMTLLSLSDRLDSAAERRMREEQKRLGTDADQLEMVSPLSVLARGFGAVFASDGSLVRTASSLRAGQDVTLRFSDGTAEAEIKKIPANGQPERKE